MRQLEATTQFKRDYKREQKGRFRDTLEADLRLVLDALVNERPLDHRHHDHPLVGEWNDHRDCHLKPDLVLIYRLADPERLQLVRLGSHSELGL